MTLEWARFQKYTRRMRRLKQYQSLDHLSLEVLLVLQLRTISNPLFPNLENLEVWLPGKSIPFIPLFLFPRITAVSIGNCHNLPRVVVTLMITTISTVCLNLQGIALHSLPRGLMITTAVSTMLLSVRTDLTNRPTELMLVSYDARYMKLWGNCGSLQSGSRQTAPVYVGVTCGSGISVIRVDVVKRPR